MILLIIEYFEYVVSDFGIRPFILVCLFLAVKLVVEPDRVDIIGLYLYPDSHYSTLEFNLIEIFILRLTNWKSCKNTQEKLGL